MSIFHEVIPYEYLEVREQYLKEQLKSMPIIRSGTHGDSLVYRLYDNNGKCLHEITNAGSSWSKADSIYKKIESINQMLQVVKSLKMSKKHRGGYERFSVKNTDNLYDNDYYDSLKDGSCPSTKNSKYSYKGRDYRSRAEMLIATVLDELGLEFKYDVLVMIDGKEFTFDFVIVFREFNRCIFIEYYGKCEESDYNYKNSRKIFHSNNNDIYLGRDLFVFSGNSIDMPGTDTIRYFLCAIIHLLSEYHIGRDS